MAIDARRPSGRRSYLEYVQSRLMHLARALDNLDAIFAEPDIDYAINQFANDASPPQNRGRFRFWLLVYLCFGRNMWALLPPFHRLGRQAGKYSDVKLGAPSKANGKFHGYMLDLCVRHIWVEVDSTIIRLDAKLKIRDDESLLFVSIEELKQWREARARVNAKFEEHRSAAAAEMMESFEESTGEKWTVGQRKSGPAKKDRQETKEANRHVSGRKSA
ncbi:hypothetical protein X636_17585 [Pandoraea pnomenusa]|nr:hypothetical protein X636_17585 [Pandoraea pnomenusa]